MSRPKRTRPIRGKYFLTVPHVAIQGRIYEITRRISQVTIEDVGRAQTVRSLDTEPRTGSTADIDKLSLGEIERGRVDGEEDVNPLHEDGVDANPE